MEEVYDQLTSASEGDFDVGLLDAVVQTAYDPSNPQVLFLTLFNGGGRSKSTDTHPYISG